MFLIFCGNGLSELEMVSRGGKEEQLWRARSRIKEAGRGGAIGRGEGGGEEEEGEGRRGVEPSLAALSGAGLGSAALQ